MAGAGAASTSRQATNIQATNGGPSAPPAYSFTIPANHMTSVPQPVHPSAATVHRGSSVDLPNIRIVNDVYYIDITDDEGDMAGDATDRDA